MTKSGTNSFHGSAYEYNRNSYFSANDYFLKYSQLNSGDPNKPQFLNRNIFGGSVGGPIKKDRLFFFLNYEAYRDVEQVSSERTVPTAALRDGVVQYACDASANCPGNTAHRLQRRKLFPGSRLLCRVARTINGHGRERGQSRPGVQPTTHPVPTPPCWLTSINTRCPNDFSQGDGLNTAGYRFASPTTNTKNWYIAKMDYNITQDGKQRVSLTGAWQTRIREMRPFCRPIYPKGECPKPAC